MEGDVIVAKQSKGATKVARTVQFNSHISYDQNQYSVLYKYIGEIVDVVVDEGTINIYHNNVLICRHLRSNEKKRYMTIGEHMPDEIQSRKLKWNAERFKEWAHTIGASTLIVVHKLLTAGAYEQTAYKGVMAILTLAKKHGSIKVEESCRIALATIRTPKYKDIKSIIDG